MTELTVTAAAGFVTPQDVADASCGLVSASDPRLPGLLDAVCAAVRRFCRWHVAPVLSETVTLDGPGGRLLTLPTLALAEAPSVTIDGVLLDPSAYRASRLGMVQRTDGPDWPTDLASITVEMSHGFDSAPDVIAVVTQVVLLALSSPTGATREQAETVSVQWSQTAPNVSGGVSLLERDLAILRQYRLP